jgi:signal transduction histidine kinase
MKFNITFRIFAFAALIVLLALLIGGAAHYGWQQFEGLRSHLSMTPLASFRSADQFRATIEELDYLLLRYSLQHDERDWNTFLPTSTNLDRWIDEQKANLTTLQEQQLWDKINFLYDDYQEAARNLRKHRLNPQLPSDDQDFAKVEDASRRMMDVAFQLAGAHQQSMELFVSQFEHSLAILRRLIFGALFALLVLGFWLSLVVYRDMIAPLRRQLVESQTIIERQEKLASLGVLAAGVAHEIRNPLTAIKARLFTQQKLLSAGTPELEDSVVIGNEINRLEKIVRDVLQFARPADPKLMKVDAATPLREARDLLAPQLQKRGIALILGTITDAQVSADPDQIKQVLINLIQNAAESIDDNGTVTLSAQCDTRRLHGQPHSTVILEVSDTGKGISLEIQKRLFDPFFSTKETGTGLGLTIAARIIEKHGGALEFRTQVNRGTAFGIVLPRV